MTSFPNVGLRLRASALACLAAALVGTTVGCSNPITGPSDYAPYSQTDLRVGTGATAATGSVVTVNYTGWLYDGSQPEQKGVQFETSLGATPFTFTLGANQVIPGWEKGVPGMNAGGIRRLVLPPSEAYGNRRYGKIPPNATLVFEIELLEVK